MTDQDDGAANGSQTASGQTGDSPALTSTAPPEPEPPANVSQQPAAASDEAGATAIKKKHHLLRHELTQETQAAAAAHFGAANAEEAAHVVWSLKQRELQEAFAKVYGQRTGSCNNEWMRGKLLQALGLDARWRPPSMQPPTQAAEPAPAAEPEPGELGRTGRRRRAAAMAAMHMTAGADQDDDDLPSPTQRKAGRGAARSSGSAPGSNKRARSDGPALVGGVALHRGPLSPSSEPLDAAHGASAPLLSVAGAAGPRHHANGWHDDRAQQQQQQQQQQRLTDADIVAQLAVQQAASMAGAVGGLQPPLSASALAAADALALAVGQQLPLSQLQHQQLLMLDQQHQQQQAALHQQFLLQQRLLLQHQQQLQQQAAAASQQQQAPLALPILPPPLNAQPPKLEEQGWPGPAGAGRLLPAHAAVAQQLGLAGPGAAPLGGLPQLLSAARQQLDDGGQAAGALSQARSMGLSAADIDAITHFLVAEDARRLNGVPGLPPHVVSALGQLTQRPPSTAGAAAAVANDFARLAGGAVSPFNSIAMAAAAAAAGADPQQALPPPFASLASLPSGLSAAALAMLGGGAPLNVPPLGASNSGLSGIDLQSLYHFDY